MIIRNHVRAFASKTLPPSTLAGLLKKWMRHVTHPLSLGTTRGRLRFEGRSPFRENGRPCPCRASNRVILVSLCKQSGTMRLCWRRRAPCRYCKRELRSHPPSSSCTTVLQTTGLRSEPESHSTPAGGRLRHLNCAS